MNREQQRAQQRLTGTDRAIRCYELAARGVSQHQIAEDLHISRSAVVRAIQRGQQITLADFKQQAGADLVDQLARVQSVFNQALASFEESRHPATRKRSSHRTNGSGDESRISSIDVVDTAPGVVGFLKVAMQALAERSKLLGLYPPQQVRIDVPDGRPHGDSSEEQIKQELAVLFKQAGLDPATFK